MYKTILGIESSCDETACAIAQIKNDRVHILSSVVASSLELQSKFGGVVPEQAAREQLKSIIPVITEALHKANLNPADLDAIAVTYGPGLIGSLLVGVETAKVLSLIWNKPVIPINHLLGHFYANWIFDQQKTEPKFPAIGLLVSGGHTDLVYFTDHNKYLPLGGTRDDAAGECFDKCARILGLPYPGGPQISKLAKLGNPNRYKLPHPMRQSHDLDFSYSGLKTAVSNLVNKNPTEFADINSQTVADLCASIEQTIIKSLTEKLVLAIKKHEVEHILVAGGVAANQALSDRLLEIASENNIQLHIPAPVFCTDNAAMIASAGFFATSIENSTLLDANPNLYF